MGRDLLKVHGSNNTFYLIEGAADEYNWEQLGKWLCDPKQEGGADGLLVVLPSEHANAKMRVINADGSEASMCGNGLRCVARYVLDDLNKVEATIETMKADLHVKRDGLLIDGIDAFSVEIAPISFDLSTLPMVYKEKENIIDEQIVEFAQDFRFTAISVPNPHLIAIVTKEYIEDSTHQEKLAAMLNGENAYTPDGVNLSYVLPISKNEIFVRTYERGVGFTNACGTAMTASSLVASLLKQVSEEVITVYNPGGFVKCHVKQQNKHTQLSLSGNATYIKKFSLNRSEENYSLQTIEEFDEHAVYSKRMKIVKEKLK